MGRIMTASTSSRAGTSLSADPAPLVRHPTHATAPASPLAVSLESRGGAGIVQADRQLYASVAAGFDGSDRGRPVDQERPGRMIHSLLAGQEVRPPQEAGEEESMGHGTSFPCQWQRGKKSTRFGYPRIDGGPSWQEFFRVLFVLL